MISRLRTIAMRRMRRSERRLRRPFASRALILMYHRVVSLPSDPQLLCVTPEHFAEHLEVLRHYCQPLTLLQLREALAERRLPNRAVAVTFDDGYADNLEYAAPLLEHYDIPATLFVTSGALGQQGEFWWDELDRLVLQPTMLPDPLALRVDGRTYRWELGSAARYTPEEACLHRGWHVEQPVDPGPRQRLYRSLYDLLQPLSPTPRQQALDELRAAVGVSSIGRTTHRTLTVEELSCLARGGSMEVGAHSVTHPLLAKLSAEAQRSEIEQSKACLEEVLERPIRTFSYPHGSRGAETATIVRQAGFVCACSSDHDVVWPDADRFGLPRVVVRDCDGDMFARRLKEWMRG